MSRRELPAMNFKSGGGVKKHALISAVRNAFQILVIDVNSSSQYPRDVQMLPPCSGSVTLAGNSSSPCAGHNGGADLMECNQLFRRHLSPLEIC